MTRVARTVLGDIHPDTLGLFDYHEHLFQTSPLLRGDELDDEDESTAEAADLHRSGIEAMVEATPRGLGARPTAVARISASTGLTVVHTTGAHHTRHYAEDHPLTRLSAEQLASLFVSDVTQGLREESGLPSAAPNGEPVRAGLVKAGVEYWRIDSFELRVLEAAAATHRVTSCPIMVHLEHGSAAHEVLDLLDAEGVDARAVALAHIDRNLDPGLHLSLIERGAFLGFDGMARHREAPDSAILDDIAAIVDGGGTNHVLLGGDVARSTRYLAYGGMPGLQYLPTRFLPRLAERISHDAYEAIVCGNGADWLSFDPPDSTL